MFSENLYLQNLYLTSILIPRNPVQLLNSRTNPYFRKQIRNIALFVDEENLLQFSVVEISNCNNREGEREDLLDHKIDQKHYVDMSKKFCNYQFKACKKSLRIFNC